MSTPNPVSAPTPSRHSPIFRPGVRRVPIPKRNARDASAPGPGFASRSRGRIRLNQARQMRVFVREDGPVSARFDPDRSIRPLRAAKAGTKKRCRRGWCRTSWSRPPDRGGTPMGNHHQRQPWRAVPRWRRRLSGIRAERRSPALRISGRVLLRVSEDTEGRDP